MSIANIPPNKFRSSRIFPQALSVASPGEKPSIKEERAAVDKEKWAC